MAMFKFATCKRLLLQGILVGHFRKPAGKKEVPGASRAQERDVEKLRLEKDQMNQDILESERQVLGL